MDENHQENHYIRDVSSDCLLNKYIEAVVLSRQDS